LPWRKSIRRIHFGKHFARNVPGNRQFAAYTDRMAPLHLVVGTGVDPVTFRFSGGRSAN
jgi:hypothetical protein